MAFYERSKNKKAHFLGFGDRVGRGVRKERHLCNCLLENKNMSFVFLQVFLIAIKTLLDSSI